uniref:Uncharacterized protein n=1 Tax=Aegilops tauschii subsp. strangulata TaxID=200361 RepID=A0A453BHN7_AEGTS
MNKIGVHSLRAAEEFLLGDINENSSKLEKYCFQIAFVIFVVGHVLGLLCTNCCRSCAAAL